MSQQTIPPRDEILRVVKASLKEFISTKKVDRLSETTPLITGGVLDSITLVELVAALEDHFGTKFQTHEMGVDYFDNLADIVDIVQQKLAG